SFLPITSAVSRSHCVMALRPSTVRLPTWICNSAKSHLSDCLITSSCLNCVAVPANTIESTPPLPTIALAGVAVLRYLVYISLLKRIHKRPHMLSLHRPYCQLISLQRMRITPHFERRGEVHQHLPHPRHRLLILLLRKPRILLQLP